MALRATTGHENDAPEPGMATSNLDSTDFKMRFEEGFFDSGVRLLSNDKHIQTLLELRNAYSQKNASARFERTPVRSE